MHTSSLPTRITPIICMNMCIMYVYTHMHISTEVMSGPSVRRRAFSGSGQRMNGSNGYFFKVTKKWTEPTVPKRKGNLAETSRVSLRIREIRTCDLILAKPHARQLNYLWKLTESTRRFQNQLIFKRCRRSQGWPELSGQTQRPLAVHDFRAYFMLIMILCATKAFEEPCQVRYGFILIMIQIWFHPDHDSDMVSSWSWFCMQSKPQPKAL